MQISFGKKFVFVANTKTASTSIENALLPHADIVRAGNPRRKHTPLYNGMRSYPLIFNNHRHSPERYFKFGVMRDPIDWIGSWYRYRSGNQVESPLPRDISFEEFWAMKDWNVKRSNGSKNLQRDMFIAPDGSLLADMVIPYTKLDDMFAEICKQLQINDTLPRQNVSRVQETGDIPAWLREEMQSFYAEDYALFRQLDDINTTGINRLRAGRGFVSHPDYLPVKPQNA